ncbi:type II toxin-antitoxin system VapC family toxin [uncultured Devosia sp.]|uniref:type II toxin-antitoxin system VapC family toxin n=1 Tax=uncultured Devosia sp. TaxID=211434 RepID=UPI00261CD9C4|nr:type II toxin-antitoxin system VapC family toxin [uncultured Devosia sp.]
MFVDASAAISILSGEEDSAALTAKLERADKALMSPIAVYETVAGLARKRACSVGEAQDLVDQFLAEIGAEIVSISEGIGRAAMVAFERFGKGRHKADLNMGDCFAYACARVHGVPLLFKGNDFIHTDIVAA